MPPASVTMEEGRLVRWLVPNGTAVAAGQLVAEVETDKAVVEIEAPKAGVLHTVLGESEIVRIGDLLARILEPGEVSPGMDNGKASPVRPEAVQASAEAPASTAEPIGSMAGSASQRVSPAARRMAQERGVDLAEVRGTGPGGRIQIRDIEQAISHQARNSAPGVKLRRAVVDGLNASWRTIPHVHICGELDGEGIVQARDILRRGQQGVRVTVTDLLLSSLARALGDVPSLNGTTDADGTPTLYPHVNIAFAVASDSGVVAPVVRSANSLTLQRVAKERMRLTESARAGKLDKRDLGGATVTLSNLGNYPVDLFAPVITAPQIALVATGRLRQKPIVAAGGIIARHMLWVNVAIDHRAADGEAGGRLLAALQQQIEELPSASFDGRDL